MHTVFALLCFVVVIHWLIFPYISGLLHWNFGNLTIAPVPAKQPWWIWINTSCEFHYERLHNHNKAKHNKTVCIFLGIYCKFVMKLMFHPQDILEYWIEHITISLSYIKFVFSTRILYMRVPRVASDCPCVAWCHEFNTCLLYVSPLFGRTKYAKQ